MVEGRVSGVGKKDAGPLHPTPDTQHPLPDAHHPVIHVRARRIHALELPQQPIGLTGSGYRMRVTPQEPQPNNQQPDNEEPVSLPKSHDFR